MKKNLFFISFLLQFTFLYSLDAGSFLPVSYIGKDIIIRNDGIYKEINYSTITIAYTFLDYNFGYLCLDGTMPYFILEKNEINNKLILKCCRLELGYENDIRNFVNQRRTNYEDIIITIIDNDEIIFDDFSYPKGTHFYRISGPAKIPIKNAVLNDSNVRLRVKPNLNCDTWTKLSKGTKVKVKDKSSEEYEIDGEKWYWYKVDIENFPDGWVYGKYLDIEE